MPGVVRMQMVLDISHPRSLTATSIRVSWVVQGDKGVTIVLLYSVIGMFRQLGCVEYAAV